MGIVKIYWRWKNFFFNKLFYFKKYLYINFIIYKTINLNNIISTLKQYLIFLYYISLQIINTNTSLNKKKSYNPINTNTTPTIIFLYILITIKTITNNHIFKIFLFHYNQKSTYITFILTLTLINLIIYIYNIPLKILNLIYPYNFYNKTNYKLFKLINTTLNLNSIFTLTLLSQKQFKKIYYPLKPQ